jgi:hypothetical protein
MHLVPDSSVFGRNVDTLPFASYEAGETVLVLASQSLPQRLERANETLIELKTQVQAGRPRSEINKSIEKVEGLLASNGASLVYAGYPYDPYA